MTVKTVNADEADVTTRVRIFDATTSLPATGIAYNTSGLGLYYERERAAQTLITPASLSAATDAHADGGFIELGDGWYRLDLPDAACAANVASVQVGVTLSGYVAFAPTLLIEAPMYVTTEALTDINGTLNSSFNVLASLITTVDNVVDQILADTGTDGVVIAAGQAVASVSGAVGSVTGTVGGIAGTITTLDALDAAQDAQHAATQAMASAILDDTGTSGVVIAAGQTVASVTGAVGSVTGNVGGNVTGSVGSLATQAKADVKAEIVEALTVDTYAEPAAVPAATASLKDKLGWVFTLLRNKTTQTATTTTLRNDADAANIATSTRADDGTTATKGEWT